MKKLKNQQGLTLVEVLAALVILGIVFVGIMTVFPQMTLFNNKTEAKLDTMSSARQEMASITGVGWQIETVGTRHQSDEDFEESVEDQMSDLGYAAKAGSAEYYRFQKQSGDYLYEVDVWKKCVDFPNEKNTVNQCLFSTATPTRLNQIHLKIFIDDLLSSETYSYIKFSQEND